MTAAEHALEVTRRGPVALWTVRRPATRNAVDLAVADGLARALDELGDTRAVILRGGDGTFISGGDLGLIRRRPFRETLALSQRMTALLARIEAAPVPFVAAVEGHAYGGGCEVLLACDYVVADPTARLSFRQAAMGLTTGWGATSRLAARVPRGVATRLLMTAEVLDAETARTLGLVDEVDAAPSQRALDLGATMSRLPAAAVAGFKQTLAAAYGQGTDDARRVEWEVFRSLWGGDAHRAALGAYFERRASKDDD